MESGRVRFLQEKDECSIKKMKMHMLCKDYMCNSILEVRVAGLQIEVPSCNKMILPLLYPGLR